ncbi:MAG: aldo/keto reductase [Halanaerobiales bacterium]
MLKRKLGRTGKKVSVFGFGGIVVKDMVQEKADKIVKEAIERGVNYFDVAPNYGDAQEKLGPALKPYRDQAVLACKTDKRTRDEAKRELHESLELLETDHFDVYQLHGIDDPDEIKTALGDGGALEAFEEARDEGLIHNIGFSCHSQPSALKLMESYDFDTVLFPINWCYWLNRGAGKKVLEKANSRNMGIIAMKGLAHRPWQNDEDDNLYPNCWYKPIYDDRELAAKALRFTLSRQVSVALSPGDARMLRLGLDIVENKENIGISEKELNELKELAEKTEPIFDHSV